MKNEKEAARRNVLVVEAVLIAILVMALTVLLVLYFEKDAPEQRGELSFEEMETAVSDGDESETAPQPEYVYERIHLEDSILGDISIPTMPDVRRHSYSWDNLTEENGRYYYESDTWQSRTGIDVSYFQGEIDWEQVKNDGIDFAIIRLGFRGYGTGNIVIDEQFISNINGALNAGLEVGVYFFSQAVTQDEAVREAETVLSMIENYQITYPVVYDLEIIDDNGSRTRDLTSETMTANAAAFCSVIEDAGYDAVYYATLRTALLKYDMAQLTDYDLWYVQSEEEPAIPYDFIMWQYTSEGEVDGIEVNVSLNQYFERKTADGNTDGTGRGDGTETENETETVTESETETSGEE